MGTVTKQDSPCCLAPGSRNLCVRRYCPQPWSERQPQAIRAMGGKSEGRRPGQASGVYMAHSTPVDDCPHLVASLPQATNVRAHLPLFPLCAEEDLPSSQRADLGWGEPLRASWVECQGLCLGPFWGASVTGSVMCDDRRTPRE